MFRGKEIYIVILKNMLLCGIICLIVNTLQYKKFDFTYFINGCIIYIIINIIFQIIQELLLALIKKGKK